MRIIDEQDIYSGYKLNLMKNLYLLISSLVFCCLVPSSCITQSKTDTQANIVFIMIDDMGWTDLGYMGSEYYETPAIDRLASEGMIFTNAYSNAANCAPTRSSLLSGQYTPRHGVFTVGKSTRGKSETRRLIPVENSLAISLDKISIAKSLKKGGYVSAAIGKWHIGNSPEDHGFDYGIDRGQMQVKGHFRENGDYLSDLLTDEAVNFIRTNNPKETGKPFFVYLAHHAVHTPIQAKEELIDKYSEIDGVGCHDNATYAAMIESVDESVARIHQTLEELELSENTLLVFFSDNGGHGTFTCQKPLRGGKGMYYEGGIRVPMFVFWPGKIKAGTRCEEPVISTDFYPTFLELAGIGWPANYPLDGTSLVPFFNGDEPTDRNPLFWHFPAYLEAYQGMKEESRDTIFRTRPVSVIRDGDWKLLLFHEEWALDGGHDLIDQNNSVELYNLMDDIGERNNLATIEKEKREELLNKLFEWQKSVHAPNPNVQNPDYVDLEKSN